MTEQSRGLRTLPPALLIAFAIALGMMIVRLVYLFAVKEQWPAIRLDLVNEGTSFASEVLQLLGVLALASRTSGRTALGVKIAAAGFAAVLLVGQTFTFIQFMERPWEHEWIYKVAEYAFFSVGLAVPIGLLVANWRDRRVIAIGVLVICLVTWPPPFLAKTMFGWIPEGKTGWALHSGFGMIRLVALIVGFAAVSRMAAVEDRVLGASGLRTAARSLWLRLIAAVIVPLLTLMAIGGSGGGKGAYELLKLATFSALIINILSLAQFGVGALRSVRAEVVDLGRWTVALGGTASLWAAGVMLGQMPWMYKMLYGSGETSFGSRDFTDYAQALSVAMPLAIIGGMSLIAVAISGLAARRGNDDLRAQAQAKGAGFVTLNLVALAISNWMLKDAKSYGSAMMMLLLAAGASVVAIVLLAKLLGLGADELEKEPGLPPASVVSDGT